MRRTLLLLVSALTVLLAVMLLRPGVSVDAQTTRSNSDRYFLKIDGVEGEVNEVGYTNTVAVKAFSWTQPRPLSNSARVESAAMHFVLWTDKATPVLMRKAAALERLPKVTLIARNSAGMDYLKWTFSDGLISSFGTESALGDNRPSVTLDVVFAKAEVEYRLQQNNGGLGAPVKGWWELVTPK
jgi:type VI protein secretion system component Hcp